MNNSLLARIKSIHISNFKVDPILIFAPGRVNLIGEHTDYNDGYVLPAAIDKGIIAGLSKSNSDHSSVIASGVNEKLSFSIENIETNHEDGWKNYVLGVVAEIQNSGKTLENFNLVFGGDIPIGAGLSSSAALENSIVFGLNELFSLNLSKREMIFISQQAEHNYAGVLCGIMDQYSSMFGQKGAAILLDCQNLDASIIDLNLNDYSLLLINTNVKHSLADSAYNERRSTCDKVASILNISSLREATQIKLDSIKDQLSEHEYYKAKYVIHENARVLKASQAIKNNNLPDLGNLLYASHDGLQHQYQVSCEELDFLVALSKNMDSIIGSRMMGGGFGGCTINIVKNKDLQQSKDYIADVYSEKFNSKCSFYEVNIDDGTRVISSY